VFESGTDSGAAPEEYKTAGDAVGDNHGLSRMDRNLWYLGLLLIAAGVTFAAVPSAGFGALFGDSADGLPGDGRSEGPISLVATDTEVTDAGPGSESTDSTSRTAAGTTEEDRTSEAGVVVAALVNDADATINVTYRARTDADAIALRNASDTVTIPQGGQHRLFARCVASTEASGTARLTVTVVETSANTTASNRELDVRVAYDCTGGETATARTSGRTATDRTDTTAGSIPLRTAVA
jgi:hypothetical protein